MCRPLRIPALIVLIIFLIGWASVPSSLTFGAPGECQMACCLAHGRGGDGDGDHCSIKHRRAGDKHSDTSFQADVGAACSANCTAPASSAMFFPNGINREITRLSSLSNSADPLPRELEQIHNPLTSAPAPTRAPPEKTVFSF
jgi:hypothetical protein